MDTRITRISKRENKDGTIYLTIYFKYFDEERFSYLSNKALKYWKSKGITKYYKGQGISVMQIPKTNNFNIFYFDEYKER